MQTMRKLATLIDLSAQRNRGVCVSAVSAQATKTTTIKG
jgi:hypothetical protein